MNAYFPYIISLFLGYLTLELILKNKVSFPLALKMFLGFGLGVGISSYICFTSLTMFNEIRSSLILPIHAVWLLVCFCLFILRITKKPPVLTSFKTMDFTNTILTAILMLLSIPLWKLCHFYVFGGWDAWSTWNLKAKFIYLGSTYWQNMFDPILWRSSPHYPLLLPLVNVWGWIWTKTTSQQIPVLTTFLMTFSTLGLLLFSIKHHTKSVTAISSVSVLLTLPYFLKMSLSQYCDVFVGYYLLAALFCLINAKKENANALLFLCGLFLGFMGFSKNEGLIGCLLIIFFATIYLVWKNKHFSKKNLLILYTGALITSIPTIIFSIFYAPDNQTFINGLISNIKPSTFYRLKVILSFYLLEFVSWNWNGFLITLFLGILISFKRSFHHKIIIIPAFLLTYSVIVTAYYFVNTHFDIDWWLSVSLQRIIYALLPTIIFWVFFALWQENECK